MPRDQPHLMGAVAQAARKSWERRQGLSTKGSSAGLSDVSSDALRGASWSSESNSEVSIRHAFSELVGNTIKTRLNVVCPRRRGGRARAPERVGIRNDSGVHETENEGRNEDATPQHSRTPSFSQPL